MTLTEMENITCESLSTNSVTNSYWMLKGEDAIDGYISASFCLLFIVFGLPCNVLVLVTVIKEKLYKQPSILLLLNLILTDIAFLVIPVPLLVVTGLAGEYIVGNTDWIRCQTCPIAFETLTLMYNSLFIIAMMSVDRFLYIYKPLQYERLVTKVWILVPMLIAWIVSICIGIASRLVGFRNINFQPVLLSCSVDKGIIFVIVLILVGFVPLTVIAVCNVLIIRIVLKNIKIIYGKRNSEENNLTQEQFYKNIKKIRDKKQLHLFRVFGALLFSNAITWLPYMSVLVALLLVGFNRVSHTAVSVVFVLFYSQSVIHPLIQTIFIADVRNPLMKRVTCGSYRKYYGSSSKENTKQSIPCKEDCCNNLFFFNSYQWSNFTCRLFCHY